MVLLDGARLETDTACRARWASASRSKP